MNNVEKLLRSRPYETLRVDSEPSGDSHWMYMHADSAPGVRPCFHSNMLDDVLSFMNSITLRESQRQSGKLRHLVVASEGSAFNLGGGLALFPHLIRGSPRDRFGGKRNRRLGPIPVADGASGRVGQDEKWQST